MSIITVGEVQKLAAGCHIALTFDEAEKITQEIADVLQYAAFLKDLASGKKPHTTAYSPAGMRKDDPIAIDAHGLLAAAPERQENYFVVPMILKHS